jgi:hypothetical protein
MTPQMGSSEPLHEQSKSTYGQYEGNQAFTQQQYETPYGQPPHNETIDDDFVETVAQRIAQRLGQGAAGKVYPQPQPFDKNVLRIALAVISMLMLVLFAFLFVIMVGGTGGWISFGIASFTIFLIATVAIDKIK